MSGLEEGKVLAIVGKKSSSTTPLQKFRLLTEGLLMEVAQESMVGQYPNTGRRPYRKQGLLYTLLRLFFLPGFKLTPWPLRHRLMQLFFVHRQQQNWPKYSWPQPKDKSNEPG
ncbi:MAG: hypothetical protein AB1801_27095 [Chloroflexota bacterium]